MIMRIRKKIGKRMLRYNYVCPWIYNPTMRYRWCKIRYRSTCLSLSDYEIGRLSLRVLLLLTYLNCSNWHRNCSSSGRVAEIYVSLAAYLSERALIFYMALLFVVITIDHRAIFSSSSKTSSSALGTTVAAKMSISVALSSLHVSSSSSAATNGLPSLGCIDLRWL